MDDNLEQTREKIIKSVKEKKKWIIYIVLAIIVWFGTKIRLSNLHLLKDATTGEYIPLALDPHVFLRYAQYIVDHGKLMVVDTMRNVPLGLETAKTNPFLSYTIAYLYKIIKVFVPSITLANVDVLYPVIFFVPMLIVFFLLVKRLFNSKIALFSTAFLAVIPTFLYRTMAGFSDKEPLGLFLMFLAIYFYVVAWQSKKVKIAVLFGALSGVSTGLMNLAWGGGTFLLIIIALFNLIEIFLDKFTKKDFYIFTSWLLFVTLILFKFKIGFDFRNLLTSYTTGISFLVLFTGFILIYLIKRNKVIKEKIKGRVPLGLASLVASLLFVTLITSIFISPTFLPNKISDLKEEFIHPFGTGRITLTVAESHQPYFTDWKQNFGWFFYFFFIGSILLFYQLAKSFKKFKWLFLVLYIAFLSAFIFSRYSRQAKIFNGETSVANFLYLGSLIIFLLAAGLFYLYSFYKDKEIFREIKTFDKRYTFVFVWFFLMIIAARGAIRLFIVLTPIATILASSLIVSGIDFSLKLKDRIYKIISLIIILLIVFSSSIIINGKEYGYDGILVKFAKASSGSAKYMGPSYHQQWQQAMKWVRENTPENSVFAHWWDYGYWVQTGANRNTILDGGNFIAPWNNFMARSVLTSNNEIEALEFLKVHDATHLLIISDEVGKYPAYSSIGSDRNYDRYSWINTFITNPEIVTETRDEIIYVYQGVTMLDEDFIYDGQLFPKQNAAIAGFFIPLAEADGGMIIKQPSALIVYNGQQIKVPLGCVYLDKEINFEQSGLKGCLKLIPTIESDNTPNKGLNFFAGAIYISERARKTLWVNLFLLGKELSYFKEVYNDENITPLAIYAGRLIGPLKIWEISYPENIAIKEKYLSEVEEDI
ncbi:hypothetical protein CL621_02930 [archaeon]|nr:hypothetical protein [archaeon]|tara:strand:- start:1482 stop:4112 length:2631 start_codon:yes stop_codon:yes gene_type:complete